MSREISAQTDTLQRLQEAVVLSHKNESMLSAAKGTLHIDSRMLKTTPAFLGSTDPLRIARYLPSMQASSELDAGIHIQGNDHSHNLIASGGVPIYGASHLFGLFSVFNPSHFTSMDYATAVPEANRLGGKLDIALPVTPAQKLSGEASLGLLAFQGSATLPVGKDASLTVSARRSYINLLYGKFLRFDSSALRYGFTDVNVTGIWRPSRRDKLWLDAYYGNDAVMLKADNGTMSVDLRWRNAMAALHHHRTGSFGGEFRQKAYVTHYGLEPLIAYASVGFHCPSDILSAGYDASWHGTHWRLGASAVLHQVHPQELTAEGSYFSGSQRPPSQFGQEYSILGGYVREWGSFRMDASLKGILWRGPDRKWRPEVAPELALSYNLQRAGKLELRTGVRYQHLTQAGFTGIGLPFEFWMIAGEYSAPQRSIGVSLQHQWSFADDAFGLTTELYYRDLRNQVEYKDGLTDLISGPYSLEKALRVGNGRAFGLNVLLQRKAGPVTGWLSFSWGRSLRTFDPEEGEVPAFHERTFELDLVASYTLRRWTFSLTSLLADGTPYTPATALYILSNYVLVEYGPHNSARLPLYHRTDVGVTYSFGATGPVGHSLNLSIYNVFFAKNAIYRSLSMDSDSFRYGFEGIGIRFMPSLAYTCHF